MRSSLKKVFLKFRHPDNTDTSACPLDVHNQVPLYQCFFSSFLLVSNSTQLSQMSVVYIVLHVRLTDCELVRYFVYSAQNITFYSSMELQSIEQNFQSYDQSFLTSISLINCKLYPRIVTTSVTLGQCSEHFCSKKRPKYAFQKNQKKEENRCHFLICYRDHPILVVYEKLDQLELWNAFSFSRVRSCSRSLLVRLFHGLASLSWGAYQTKLHIGLS